MEQMSWSNLLILFTTKFSQGMRSRCGSSIIYMRCWMLSYTVSIDLLLMKNSEHLCNYWSQQNIMDHELRKSNRSWKVHHLNTSSHLNNRQRLQKGNQNPYNYYRYKLSQDTIFRWIHSVHCFLQIINLVFMTNIHYRHSLVLFHSVIWMQKMHDLKVCRIICEKDTV